ncbi:biotin synthase [Lachnospiraceae bacterium XBB1006]|nr:biotin synthase [Lachnospiraceae bacterium XBB1006]
MELTALKEKVLAGGEITREEALFLCKQPLEKLAGAADEIRRKYCGDSFDLCTIINGKSGKCSENCKFCAQSAHHHTQVGVYPLLSTEEIVADAKKNAAQGVLRYSIVTAGRRLNEQEVEAMCEAVRAIRKEADISVCISFGLLDEMAFRKLKEAGVSRVHNNLETSRSYFPEVCTTHTYEEKIAAIKAAKAAGLSVCSGGIMGLGETFADRIDMALTLRELHVKSVPVNMLNPIPGTPFEKNERLTKEEMMRIVAVYRFLLPDASIRLAGGRGLMGDKGIGCFTAGANAAISGDMLTTAGITVKTDKELLEKLGYKVELQNE